MENIVYLKLGTENKIIEIEETLCRIVCMYVKKPMEQAHWWERYKFYKDLKKVVNPFELFLQTNQGKKVIFDPAFWEEMEQHPKWKKLFSFLEEYHYSESIHEEIVDLFLMREFEKQKWNSLEELIIELPRQEVLSSELEARLTEWIHLLSPTLNYLTIISENTEQYEDLEQQLYEETGLMLQTIKDKRQLELLGKNKKRHRGSKALWIDLGVTKLNYRAVPRHCIYFDANNEKEKARTLGIKRPDVSYVSVLKFLDTFVDHIV